MPVLELQCDGCNFRFKVGYISIAEDIAYCPHCGDSFLEYWPRRDGERYQFREKNWFYHQKPDGPVWHVDLEENDSHKKFFIDIQGPETKKEAFEAAKEFLIQKKWKLAVTVTEIRLIGTPIKVVRGDFDE